MKILSIVGTRPNLVKIAAFCREISKVENKIDHFLVHTGQHYDSSMSREFFDSLSIPEPNVQLDVGSASHAVQTANIMTKFEQVCLSEKPDWVVVVGDVNSTLAGALVAKKLGINLAHIEAGLRSFDMTMPEEINRKVVDSVADILFTPSVDADENLKNEGINENKIKLVGNIMIDTLVNELDKAERRRSYEKWGAKPLEYVYVTLHRPSNVDSEKSLSDILDILIRLSTQLPVLFPLHPRTRKQIETGGLNRKALKQASLHLIDPVPYHDSISLAKNAKFVLTDSGGIQEETTFMGVPCLTLRPNTERPVTLIHGTNRLTSPSTVWNHMDELLKAKKVNRTPVSPKLWDGKTAKRIINIFEGLID